MLLRRNPPGNWVTLLRFSVDKNLVPEYTIVSRHWNKWAQCCATSWTKMLPVLLVSRKATWIREQEVWFCIVIFDRFLPCKDKNDQRETIAFTRGNLQHFWWLLSEDVWIFGATEVRSNFNARGWVRVTVHTTKHRTKHTTQCEVSAEQTSSPVASLCFISGWA